MAKTKIQKQEILNQLDSKIANMKSAVIVEYKGLKVKDIEALRKNLLKQNISFNVSKNTLTRIALKKNGIEFDEGVFAKPVAVAFAQDDEVAPAKDIVLFAKSNEAINILGGILEKKFIDESMIRKLASLPSKDELRGKLVGVLSAPISGTINAIGGNLRSLISILNQVGEKK
jgi:large subunit ribosomal protein L10